MCFCLLQQIEEGKWKQATKEGQKSMESFCSAGLHQLEVLGEHSLRIFQSVSTHAPQKLGFLGLCQPQFSFVHCPQKLQKESVILTVKTPTSASCILAVFAKAK